MSIRTYSETPGIVESVLEGAVTPKTVADGATAFARLAAASQQSGWVWVFHTAAVSIPPGEDAQNRLADALREAAAKHKLKLAIVVTTQPMVRLGVQIIAMKSKVKCEMVASVADALRLAHAAL